MRRISKLTRGTAPGWGLSLGASLLCAVVSCFARAEESTAPASVRIGIIGLDTSHTVAFTTLLHSATPKAEFAGCRVVAAFPPGSPDIASSVERVPKYTKQVRELGVEIVDSIDALLNRVDAVLLETNDGRPHFEQALPVLKAGKRMFIDKPMAASLADVIAIFEASRSSNTPIFSSSALRYGLGTLAVRGGSIGDVLGCDTFSPCALEPTHPDLFWYGIHGVESLITVMGPGCETVTRVTTPDADVAVGKWRDGRIGVFRGMRTGTHQYGGTAFGAQGNAAVGDYAGYEPLVVEIVKFFRTGIPPVSEEETLEIYAFMEAADESKRSDGRPVAMEAVMASARRAAQQRLTGR